MNIKLHALSFILICLSAIEGLFGQSTIYEAENAIVLGSNSVGNEFEGFSGSGYIGGFAKEGDKVIFTVSVEKAGTYELNVGYMSKFGNKENYLVINGEQLVNSLVFPGSTVFTETRFGNIQLKTGINTIEILRWWGFCWVDYIKVGGVGPIGKIVVSPDLPLIGKPFTVSAEGSYHPNGDSIVNYLWTVNNNDEFNGKEFNYTFPETGRYPVQLILTDINGNETKMARNIVVVTGIPYATFSVSPSIADAESEIVFNAYSSIDYNGEIVLFSWDFGDGNEAQGISVTHKFLSEGNYLVRLSIKDNDGNEVSTGAYVFVYPSSQIIRGLQMEKSTVGLFEKAELLFQINKNYTNVFDPDEVKVDAIVKTDGSDSLVIPCFHFTRAFYNDTTWKMDSNYKYWMLRYSPREIGTHNIRIRLTDHEGTIYSDPVSFSAVPSDVKGFIRVDDQNKNYYRHETGEPYFPLGMHLQGNEDLLKHPNWQLQQLKANNANFIRQWIVGQTQLEWTGGRYKGLGYYSPESSCMIDTMINMFRDNDVYMQMVFNWHGQFSENVNSNWAGNPYNIEYGGFLAKPNEYFRDQRAYAQAKKYFRYVIARWGYSPNIFAWEFFNEVNFSGHFLHEPASFNNDIDAYHDTMSNYVESIDAFNHIQTTSTDHLQLKLMDDNKAMDVLQFHVYNDNLLQTIRHEASELHTNLQKPIICGEFGTPQTRDLLRKVFWQGLFIQAPSQYWYVETLIKNDWWDVYKALGSYSSSSDFAADSVNIDTLGFTSSDGLKLLALKGPRALYGYFYHPENKVGIANIVVDVKGLDFGYYRVEFINPETAEVVFADSLTVINPLVKLKIPVFSKEIAFKVKYSSPYTHPIAIAGLDWKSPYPSEIPVDGSMSYDPEGKAINFSWELVSKPHGSLLSLPVKNESKFSFIPDLPGAYLFKLTVDNNSVTGIPDTISIVSSARPIALIDKNVMAVLPGKYLKPDGSGSSDPENDVLSYKWQILSKPAGSAPELFKSEEDVPAFRSAMLGEYQLTLIVNDGVSDSDPDTLLIKVVDSLLGIQKPAGNDLQLELFPNPFTDYLNISYFLEKPSCVRIELVDTKGTAYTLVEDFVYSTGRKEMVLSPEKSAIYEGVFFLRITTSESVTVRKLLRVQRK